MELLDIRYKSNSGIEFHHTITSPEEIKKHHADISHSHAQFEIYYLVKGEVYYHVAGQKYRVNEGSLLLLNTFSPHQVETLPSSECERYVLEFTMDYIPTINGVCPAYYFFEKRHSIKIIPNEIISKTKIFSIFKEIEEEALNKNDFSAHVILGHILRIMSIACISSGDYFEDTSINNSEENKKHMVYINQITQYINANVDKKLSVDDITNYVHLSRSYLQHLFKKSIFGLFKLFSANSNTANNKIDSLLIYKLQDPIESFSDILFKCIETNISASDSFPIFTLFFISYITKLYLLLASFRFFL